MLLLALLSVASPWHPRGLYLLIFTVQVKVRFLLGHVHSLLCPVSEVKFCQRFCTSCDD